MPNSHNTQTLFNLFNDSESINDLVQDNGESSLTNKSEQNVGVSNTEQKQAIKRSIVNTTLASEGDGDIFDSHKKLCQHFDNTIENTIDKSDNTHHHIEDPNESNTTMFASPVPSSSSLSSRSPPVLSTPSQKEDKPRDYSKLLLNKNQYNYLSPTTADMSERNDGDENIQLLRAIPKEKENDEEREEREERAEGEEGEREEENINHYENENENHENHENNDNDDAHDNHDKDFTTSPSSELSENLAKLVSAMQAQRKADIDTSKVFYQQIINEMHLMADQFSVNFNSLLEQKNARYNQLIGEIQSRLRNIEKDEAEIRKIKDNVQNFVVAIQKVLE